MPQMMIAENLSINSFKIKKDNTLNELSKNKISQNYQPSAPTIANNIFYDANTSNNTNLENHLKKSVFKFAPPAIINQFDLTNANKNTKLTSRNHAQLQVHKFIPPMQHLQRASTTATQNTCLNNANNENKAKPNSNNVQMNESNKFKTKIYQNQFQLKNSKMSAPPIQQQQQQPNYNKSQNIVNPSYRSQIPIPLPAKSAKPQPQSTAHYANYVNYERAFNSKTNLPLIDMIIKNTEANRLNALYSANHCGYNITKSTNNLNSHPATPTTNNTGYSSNTLNSTHSNTSTSTKSSASHKTNLKKTASTPQLEKEPTPALPAPSAPPVESNLPVLIPLPMPFLPNYSMTMPKQIGLPAYDNQYSQYKNMSSTLSKLDTAKAGADALLPLVVKLEPLTSTPITSTPKVVEQTAEQPAKSEEKKPPQANEKKQETASSSSLSKQTAKVVKIGN